MNRRDAPVSRREYGLALLAGAVGAGLILLAVRQRWAEAVFIPPKPLTPQVIAVSGADLVPLAAAIATRGVLRRAAGVLLAAFGAVAGAAVTARVSAASVLSVAASRVGSPGSAAISGAAGSTTSGSSGGAPIVVAGSAGHAVMTGAAWQAAVLAGALLVFLAGLATVLRGPRWPVMSARYDLPRRRAGGAAPSAPGDSASMWESLSDGEDPTVLARGDSASPGGDPPEPPEHGGLRAPHSPAASHSPAGGLLAPHSPAA